MYKHFITCLTDHFATSCRQEGRLGSTQTSTLHTGVLLSILSVTHFCLHTSTEILCSYLKGYGTFKLGNSLRVTPLQGGGGGGGGWEGD